MSPFLTDIQRQQVELTNYLARTHGGKGILFLSMHPGWAATPGVEKSMPGFYSWMNNRLRSSEEGADTIVWAAASPEAKECPNGSFLQGEITPPTLLSLALTPPPDRQVVSQHLPLSWTQSKEGDVEKLVQECDKMLERIVGQ